jgi:hypothetical protein
MGRYGMENKVPDIKGRSRPRRRWFQDIKDTLKMTSHEVGVLARDRNFFQVDYDRATFWKMHAVNQSNGSSFQEYIKDILQQQELTMFDTSSNFKILEKQGNRENDRLMEYLRHWETLQLKRPTPQKLRPQFVTPLNAERQTKEGRRRRIRRKTKKMFMKKWSRRRRKRRRWW